MRIRAHYVVDPLAGMRINAHMKSADVIKVLEANGWERRSQKGSHVSFRKAGNPNVVTVPHPKKDLPLGTLRSLEKLSGLTFR